MRWLRRQILLRGKFHRSCSQFTFKKKRILNTKIKSKLLALGIVALMSLFSPIVLADIIYTSFPANVTMTPGVSFATQMQISSTNNSLGAFSVLVEYDTNVFKLVGVSPQSGSEFSSNIFTDLTSPNSGVTRVVGFQTARTNSQPETTVLNLTWQTVGTTILNSGITNVIETSVDSSWQANQTWTLVTSGTLNQTSSDGNGLPDWWEMLYFGHLGVNPNADADTNGFTNLQKYWAGLNPLDPTSTVLITKVEITHATALIHFSTVLGRTYTVEKTTAFTPGSWSAVGQPIVGTGSEQIVSDSIGLDQSSRFFYRLVVAP